MQNKIVKFILAAIFLGLCIWQFAQENIGNGFFFFFLTALVVFFIFRHEYILLSFLQLRKQNMDGAKKWLSKINNFEKALIRNQYGYYHYMLGVCEAQSNINNAESLLKKALNYGLNMDHDKALAKLTIANAAMAKGRKKEAQMLLKEAKQFDKNGMFADQIKMVDSQMKKMPGFNRAQMRKQGPKGRFF